MRERESRESEKRYSLPHTSAAFIPPFPYFFSLSHLRETEIVHSSRGIRAAAFRTQSILPISRNVGGEREREREGERDRGRKTAEERVPVVQLIVDVKAAH